MVTLLISVWKVSSNARVSTDTLVERGMERVTVELPTVSTTVKVSVTVTKYVPVTFPTTWNSPPPRADRTAPSYDQPIEMDVVLGPGEVDGLRRTRLRGRATVGIRAHVAD